MINGWMFAGIFTAATACGPNAVYLDGRSPASGGSDGGGLPSYRFDPNDIPGASPCPLPPLPAVDASAGSSASLLPLVGTWTGYIETSLSLNLTLRVAPQASGRVTASLTFGPSPPLAPPKSRSALYPPDLDGGSLAFPYPGFAYTAFYPSFDGTRLQLGIEVQEIFKTWCELQTSFDWAPKALGACGCLPDWPFECRSAMTDGGDSCFLDNPSTGASVPVDSARKNGCSWGSAPNCTCTSAGCTIDLSSVINLSYVSSLLDVHFTPNHLDGSITGIESSFLNVHLDKSP